MSGFYNLERVTIYAQEEYVPPPKNNPGISRDMREKVQDNPDGDYRGEALLRGWERAEKKTISDVKSADTARDDAAKEAAKQDAVEALRKKQAELEEEIAKVMGGE